MNAIIWMEYLPFSAPRVRDLLLLHRSATNFCQKDNSMEIGKTLFASTRAEWRSWLRKHSRKEPEIWLVNYKKDSGRPRIPYNDAVEEALCFGWIDSIAKPIDAEKYAQRFSPRRPGSPVSALNRERIRRLIRSRKMTSAGLTAVKHAVRKPASRIRIALPPDIREALKADPAVWENYIKFPPAYKHLRIAWIVEGRYRPSVFRQRLAYFIRMTAKNQRFGTIRK
jgi:uncharacterized protein YdeI (YjbR/CyaY-like superfamily)